MLPPPYGKDMPLGIHSGYYTSQKATGLAYKKHIQTNSFHVCGETVRWMACAAVNAHDSDREPCQSPSVNTRWEV